MIRKVVNLGPEPRIIPTDSPKLVDPYDTARAQNKKRRAQIQKTAYELGRAYISNFSVSHHTSTHLRHGINHDRLPISHAGELIFPKGPYRVQKKFIDQKSSAAA